MVIREDKGQTMVEYMLLLAVVMSLVYTFYNSELFRRLFGNQGSLGKMIKQQSEFSYRHAYNKKPTDPPDVARDNKNGSDHKSYTNGSETRFFGAKGGYP